MKKFVAMLLIATSGIFLVGITPAGEPFRFQSLKGKSDEEIDRFMGGKETLSHFERADSKPNTFPEKHWMGDPLEAALAYIHENRNKENHWKSDKNPETTPPSSGWIVLNWTSSGCYSLSSSITALRYGVEKPFIFHSLINSNGAVGRNPFADRTGHTLDIVPLSKDEARFIADLIFWTDHFRSRHEEDSFGFSSVSSTADGSAEIDHHPAGEKPYRIDGRIWAFRSIHDHWKGPFNDEIALNLNYHFLSKVVPWHLGKRWPARDPGHRDLTTPMAERLKPPTDDDLLDEDSQTVATALEMHRSDPWPAPAIKRIAYIAGEAGLYKTRYDLETLARTLPAATDEEKRLRQLEKEQFDAMMRRHLPALPPLDPLEKDDQEKEEEKKWKEQQALDEKFRYDLPAVVRESLHQALEKIDAVHDAEKLSLLAEKQDGTEIWALQQLQLRHPRIYTDLMIRRFHDAHEEERSAIFTTLAAAVPDGAMKLRKTLSGDDLKGIVLELTAFELKHDPSAALTRAPALLEILDDKSGTLRWNSRGPAIELLSRLPLGKEELATFERLLIREAADPRRDDIGMSVASHAYVALGKLSDPQRHWQLLVDNAGKATGYSERPALFDVLTSIAGKNPESYRKLFLALIKATLTENHGMMNDLFRTALAMDLRELAPDIQSLANESPDVPDGEGASSSGGDFKGPGSNRYHAARHVTALWQENDPETLAKMWTALVIASPYHFSGDSSISGMLRDRCKSALNQAPPSSKTSLIEKLRSNLPQYTEMIAQLQEI